MEYKTPKIEKIYEALSVIADKRIEYSGDTSARVYSSDKSKFYSLSWDQSLSKMYSDDNASKWQNTVGYPIIAILMDKALLSVTNELLLRFSNINWNKLNQQFNRDYTAAVESVLKDRVPDTTERSSLISDIEEIYAQLRKLKIEKSTKKL